MITERYINLFTDFGFKRIFGTESNKDLLIDFLNAILERQDNPIVNLKYIQNEVVGKKVGDRKSVFDLYCESSTQEKFIIELQRTEQQYFKDRALYYTSSSLQEQGKQGKGWEYELLPTYTIAIMDFVFDAKHSDYASYVKLMNVKTHEVFYEKLTFVFLEMPKYQKVRGDLASSTDKWLYVLKHMHTLAEMPMEVQEGVFLKLFEQCEIANYTEREYMSYEESVKIYNDLYATTQTAMRKGFAEGMVKGRAEGVEEGVKTTARNAIKEGFSDDIISKLTGLSVEEVEALRLSMQP